MVLSDIRVEDVEHALAEARELGRGPFLEKYGFGPATSYLLRSNGRFYDPKAVVGVAHGHATDTAWGPRDFDATEAIARLRSLSFEVADFSGLWWVNQGATYQAERAGGFVWAPKLTKSGRPAPHHVAVNKLRPGQRLIHYTNGKIRAVGTVTDEPEFMARPTELRGEQAWDTDGYGCRVHYRELEQPIDKTEVPNRVPAVGPFDVNGDLKQGYLFPITEEGLFPLLEFLDQRIEGLLGPSSEGIRPSSRTDTVSLPPAEPDPIHDLLSSVKSVVLEGVPGTGKTYAVQTLAEHWFERTGRRLLELDGQPYAAMVMHPSTSYEDFVEGLRPGKDVNAHEAWFDEPAQGDRDFSVEDGFFLRVCAAAVRHPERDVLVLLDELNRCNVPSVLGDLLLVLEASRRARPTVERGPVEAGAWTAVTPAKLPYSGRLFFVPSNVYVLATTNTTDRSVAPLDAAVRRRFAFYRLEPELVGVQALADHLPTEASRTAHTCIRMIDRLNADVLGPCIGPDALLGQSYLYSLVAELQEASSEAVVSIAARAIRYQVLPQLTEATRSYGAEDLLSPAAREEWFAHHEGAMSGAPQANAVLADFDAFLRSLGIQVVVEGTGLARGVRVRDAVNPRPRVDISFPSDADADPESVAQVDETPATTRDE